MTFNIEKLGRIQAAHIDIKPLTLFIGKNDSGKTYCASAIWAYIKYVKELGYEATLKNLPQHYSSITELIKFCKDKKEGKISIHLDAEQIGIIQKDIRQSFDKAAPKVLADAIGYGGFTNSKVGVIPHDSTPNSITINVEIKKTTAVEELENPEEEEEEDGNEDASFLDSLTQNATIDYEVLTNGKTQRSFVIELSSYNDAGRLVASQIGLDLSGYSIFGDSWKNYRTTAYLPAARTGIMLAIDFFVSGAMQRNALDPQNPRAIPQSSLPAPLRSFAAELTFPAFRPRNSKLLSSIVNGSYTITKKRGEYHYTPSGMSEPIPLAATSSLVTELAGFALMRGVVDIRNSFLIFEEPEAHLHLEAQREIAKVLVKLVNSGKRLLVTTHSDTFLQQINNLIALNDHPKKQKLLKELGIDKDETISRNLVAAYDFNCKKNITTVEKLECGATGFIAPSLNDVLLKLQLETISIQEDL